MKISEYKAAVIMKNNQPGVLAAKTLNKSLLNKLLHNIRQLKTSDIFCALTALPATTQPTANHQTTKDNADNSWISTVKTFLHKSGIFAAALLIAMFLLSGTMAWAQTTMAHFGLDNNLTPDIDNVVGTPSASQNGLNYSGSTHCDGTSCLYCTSSGDYIDIIINTTGYSSISISWQQKDYYNSTGNWYLYGDYTNDGTNEYLKLDNANVTSSCATVTIPLSSDFNEKPTLRLRLSSHVLSGTNFYLDDVKISGTLTSIALSSPSQVTSGNILKGATNAFVSVFQAAVTTANATLNSLAFSTTGTALTTTDLTNFKLYYGTTNTFANATAISTLSTSLGSGTHTFSSLTQAINSSTTGYFWITCDVPTSSTTGRTITVSASPTLTFAVGTPTGTIAAGGTQTITANTPKQYLSITSGNWSLPATWQQSTDGGTTWVAATTAPISSDGLVTVQSTHTVTLTAAATASNLTVSGTLDASTYALTGTGTLTVSSTGTLNVGGTSNFPTGFTTTALNTGSTVNYDNEGAQTVSAQTYSNLIISGDGEKTVSASTSVAGNLSISGSKANLNAGITVPVYSLTLDGAAKSSGTWGSFSSAATYKTDTYFTATTGMLNVATGTALPTPTFSSLTANQSICPGTSTTTLSGVVSSGSDYPANGELVGITINSVTQNATVAGSAGGFTVNYNVAAIPASGTPYTITYSYGGGNYLSAAVNNSETAVTISAPVPAVTGQTNITCNGGTDGSVTITASEGVAPYQYSVNNGETYTAGSNPYTYTGLSANVPYKIRVKDANNCTSPQIIP
jgi:hypothetical protein